MSVYLPEVDDIYFKKTKEYFQEVVSSYSIGNYRSATVMLYSVAICDILFKLQELKDMYDDTVADEILNNVEKLRTAHDGQSKSRWEKELIDSVYKRTELLDLEAYTNINHLYDHRNFSAHPALSPSYELIMPSKETTIANIKNILKDILIKPPIFIKNIVDAMTEDLKGKNALYKDAEDKLAIYLNNKYFSRMTQTMKIATLKAFWKFCFCLPDDENCMENIRINRQTLTILIGSFPDVALNYIRENNQLFSVANDNRCILNLTLLLSQFRGIYSNLNADAQQQIDALIAKNSDAKAISWFKFSSPQEHIELLRGVEHLTLSQGAVCQLISHYSDIGEQSILIDFFIWYYGESRSYDSADERFKMTISPFLNEMSSNQITRLIEITNSNNQIYNRGACYGANCEIVKRAIRVLDNDFDYSKYAHFYFDSELAQKGEAYINDDNNPDEDELSL